MKGENDWQQRQQRCSAWLELLCVEQNIVGSNLALCFDFFHLLSSRRICT